MSNQNSTALQPVSDAVQAAGSLVKAAANFSLAMSFYAARQAVELVAPSEQTATRMNDVTAAAGGQLTGVLKTAYAVGTNIQSGLVDAAFNLAGFGVRGQKPSGDTSGLSIPLATGATRRVTGVRTVASGAPGRPVPQTEFVDLLIAHQAEAAGGAADRERAVTGLWKSEGLSTTVGKHLLPDNTLRDPRLPRQVLPIAHVGFGSGSTEIAVFDPAKLVSLFAERCHPDYLDFSYEGIGAILRIYERGFFKVMSGALGLIRLDSPDGPNPQGFFAAYLKQFSPERQRLIAHGYGRIVAFSNMSIFGAIEEATTFPAERVEPAVHGCGFAFGFMNSADLPRLLEHSAIPFDDPVRAAFQSGLVYSLVFFDWYTPGLLAGWQPQGPLEADLIGLARREAAAASERGFLRAFTLDTPVR
jgi:hypothetical protein